ncbi:MAG: hypothetical protein F6K58_08555 [Symploca sp. SIO2E9]|nr:hypothetical protein [Symploca sp. SIO2E9]
MKLKAPAEIIPETKNKIVIGQLGLSLAFLILSFAFLQQSISNKNLSQRKVTFVQLADGTSRRIEERDGNYRDAKTIKNFVGSWLSLTFSWNGKISGTGEPDPGIKLENGGRVPVNTWAASLAMEAEFGKSFLKELAKLVPSEVFAGNLESAVYVEYYSEPRQTSTTTWEIDVIATRILLDNNRGEERIDFNKTFTLKAVEVPASPLENNANKVEQLIYQMRSSGLEIQSIVNFHPNQ